MTACTTDEYLNKSLEDLVIDYKKTNKSSNNISTLNLSECEVNLKQKYNINDSLLILKADSNIQNLFIPIIQYVVYHPINKSKLNLNVCNDSSIYINIPKIINESELYKYNPESDYYNDICFSSKSNKGTDIPILDRKNEFVKNNLYLCENNCKFIGYNTDYKESNCQCPIKKEMKISKVIKINTQQLYNKFIGTDSSNIGIIKCYYLVFSKDGLKKKYWKLFGINNNIELFY